jgi:hypothetical protein
MADTSGALNRALNSKTQNVATPVLGAKDPVTFQKLNQNFILMEVGGAGPSAAGNFYFEVGFYISAVAITPGQTPAQVAAQYATDLQTDLDAQFGVGVLEVTNPSGNEVRVQTADGSPLAVQDTANDPAMAVTLDAVRGWHIDCALLHEVTAVGAGAPQLYTSGQPIEAEAKDADGSVNIAVQFEIKNVSGGAATARWRLWWWVDYLGWFQDQELGIRSVTETSGGNIAYDTVVASGAGATRVAIELVDNGAGGALPAGATASARATIIN